MRSKLLLGGIGYCLLNLADGQSAKWLILGEFALLLSSIVMVCVLIKTDRKLQARGRGRNGRLIWFSLEFTRRKRRDG